MQSCSCCQSTAASRRRGQNRHDRCCTYLRNLEHRRLTTGVDPARRARASFHHSGSTARFQSLMVMITLVGLASQVLPGQLTKTSVPEVQSAAAVTRHMKERNARNIGTICGIETLVILLLAPPGPRSRSPGRFGFVVSAPRNSLLGTYKVHSESRSPVDVSRLDTEESGSTGIDLPNG